MTDTRKVLDELIAQTRRDEQSSYWKERWSEQGWAYAAAEIRSWLESLIDAGWKTEDDRRLSDPTPGGTVTDNDTLLASARTLLGGMATRISKDGRATQQAIIDMSQAVAAVVGVSETARVADALEKLAQLSEHREVAPAVLPPNPYIQTAADAAAQSRLVVSGGIQELHALRRIAKVVAEFNPNAFGPAGRDAVLSAVDLMTAYEKQGIKV